jgi:hypothetical protein
MPTARSAAAAAVVSGVIYVVGGGNSSGFLASNEAFTPGDGLTWSSSAPLVATIGTNGLALGVSAGAATITASSSGASGSSLLTVVVAPTIANPPLSETSAPDGSVTLSVGASGGDLSYQWEFNGTNIAGATGATLILTNLSASQAGVYTVTVSNVAGSRTSAGANVAALNLQMFAGVILDGPIGARYSVQSTPVLGPANWITVTNIIVTTQPYIYIDYSSITNSQQFYRAVPLP